MMDDDERNVFASMPKVITIFRGCQEHNRNGFSWTVCEDTARRFSKRWYQNGMILKANVTKPKVIAYLDRTKLGDSSEKEIIILHRPKAFKV